MISGEGLTEADASEDTREQVRARAFPCLDEQEKAASQGDKHARDRTRLDAVSNLVTLSEDALTPASMYLPSMTSVKETL